MALPYRSSCSKQKGAAQKNAYDTATSVGYLATYLILGSRIMLTLAS
jgi:hypothetical protein